MVILLQQRNFGPNVVYYASKWHPEGVPKASQRRPKGVQGVQNEPKCVPEGSRGRPRASKKRPGGAKLDLLVFYRLFKLTQVTRRHQAESRNNLPVREVN